MKKKLPSIILIVLLTVGLAVLLYPTFSNYWNTLRQSRAIADYSGKVAVLEREQKERLLAAAHAYNERLLDNPNRFEMTPEQRAEYNSLLSIDGDPTAIIGFLEIPVINVRLGLYHGAGDTALQTGLGHLEGSSLPVGGESTHAAVAGHRGLPFAMLLTNLDSIVIGDHFKITVLGELMTYEVDQILIVEPNDMQPLEIVPGKDYVTLITCTPYGVNSHRLLVRGVRTDNDAPNVRITADAKRINFRQSAIAMALSVYVILILYLIVRSIIKNKKTNNRKAKTNK